MVYKMTVYVSVAFIYSLGMATILCLRFSCEPDKGTMYDFAPTILLPWRYTPEQERNGDVWECGAVRQGVAPPYVAATLDIRGNELR